jgi:hypothetical protein
VLLGAFAGAGGAASLPFRDKRVSPTQDGEKGILVHVSAQQTCSVMLCSPIISFTQANSTLG